MVVIQLASEMVALLVSRRHPCLPHRMRGGRRSPFPVPEVRRLARHWPCHRGVRSSRRRGLVVWSNIRNVVARDLRHLLRCPIIFPVWCLTQTNKYFRGISLRNSLVKCNRKTNWTIAVRKTQRYLTVSDLLVNLDCLSYQIVLIHRKLDILSGMQMSTLII